MFHSHARRARGQFHNVEVVDHPRLQRRVQAAPDQFAYGFAKGDLAALRVCLYLVKHIIVER